MFLLQHVFFFLIKSICQAHFSVSASWTTACVQQGAVFASVIFQWVELEEEKKSSFLFGSSCNKLYHEVNSWRRLLYLKKKHTHINMLLKNKTEGWKDEKKNTFLTFYQDRCRMWMIMPHLGFPSKTGSAHTPIWDVAPSSGSESVKCRTTVPCPAHIHTERDRVYFDPDIVHSEAPFFSKVLGNRCGSRRGGEAGGGEQHERWTDCLAARRGIVLLCTFFSL